MSHDDCYEALAFLSALEQISPKEFSKLEQHLSVCAPCRVAFGELDSLAQEKLRQDDLFGRLVPALSSLLLGHSRYKERFLTKAGERGIPFSAQVMNLPRISRLPFLPAGTRSLKAALVLLAIAALSFFGYRYHSTLVLNPLPANGTIQLRNQNLELRHEVNNVREVNASLAAQSRAAAMLSQGRESGLQEQVSRLQAQLRSLNAQLLSTKAASDESEAQHESLVRKIAEDERRIEQANSQLEQLRAARQGDTATIAAQQYQISELSENLKDSAQKLERERQLLAANRDIRDVMGARNLHLVDVIDVDGNGKARNVFGRIFYTEGKSLIFYAFDNRNTLRNAKHSLQAWGYREPVAASAQNLGIFYLDDENQRRWVLKLDDPKVLEEIDAVFVTLEPFGGTKKPSGKKLLYAYLRNSPNHP